MQTTLPIERHFTATETIADIVIGMSDGLTVASVVINGSKNAQKIP